MAQKGSQEWIDWSTRLGDITRQLGIYEKDKPAPRPGYTSSWSPDNPYLNGGTTKLKSQWEKQQTTTYEERQAEARTAIQGQLDTFHSEFKGEYGYHWDDAQELRDIDKAWSFDAPTHEEGSTFSDAYQYNALLNQLQAGGKGEGSYSQLEDRWDADYDVRYDSKSTTQDHARMDDWGFDLMRTPNSFASADQMMISGKELDKYTGQHAHLGDSKIPISKQKLQEYGMQFDEDLSDGPHLWDSYKEKADAFGLDSSAEARSLYSDQLYDHLYSNEVDWDLYNQQDSMWQRAAQMARDDIDVSNLSNEERVGIYGIDWDSSFDRADEIRQVNQWMADRGWVMGDESTWGTELINKPPYEPTSLIEEPTEPIAPVEPPPEVIEEAAPTIPATDGVTGGLPEDWQAQVESLFGQGQSDMQEQWSEIFDEGLESIEDIYTTKFDSWEDTFNAGQKALTDQLTGFTGDFSALTGDLDDLGDMFAGLDDSVKQQYSDLGGKIGNLEGQIGHVDTKLDDVTKWNEQISDVITDYQEGQIDQQERARAKASYGSMMGQPLNPRVRGVKTINLLDNYKGMVGDFGGARGSFNRKGNKLKIGSINV